MKKIGSGSILWLLATKSFVFADDTQNPNTATATEKVTADKPTQNTEKSAPLQAPAAFVPYEKKSEYSLQPIRKIVIAVDGQPPKTEDFIRAHIQLREGDAFSVHTADEAIHSLAQTGMFDDVRLSVDQNSDASLVLNFSLTTRPKIAAIEFPHEKISNKKLKKEIKTTEGEYLNRSFINDDIQAIYRHYQVMGFPRPTIDYKIKPTDDPKFVKIVFDIVPGEGFHISAIKFTNFGDVNTEKIKKRMMLKTWSLFSFLTKKGYFIDILLDADREMIIEAMQNAGYLDAKITRAAFDRAGNSKRGVLEFVANLGQKYLTGQVQFTGNKVYPDEKIASLVKIKAGDPFSPGDIADTAEAIRNFYSYNGYINTVVGAEKIPTFTNNTIDVKLTIDESPLTYVGSISVKGNFKTKNKVILRELALAPGDKLNYIKLKNSENRLKNTEFFETVSCDIDDTDVPDRKNIQIDVKEKNTGKIQLGGAISATNNQFIFLELSQSNFDLFNGKAKFQGSGQKLHARAQIGTRENQLTLSFEEPYLFDRELAFGIDIFGEKTKYRTSDSNYSGPSYDQTAIGFEPYFRKRLYELWVGRLGYNLTRKNIRNVSETAVQPLKDEAGRRSASRVKFSVERDTRDNYIFPRSGSNVGLHQELAGLGGYTKLYKIAASATKWLTVSEKYDHTLAIAAKIGMICPFNRQATPFSERYFLGGDALMRGFEFREISPKDQRGESLGGNSFVYGGAEYTANIFDDFYFATFAEVGNVGVHQSPFRRGWNADAGCGLRIFIGGMPLRLDWGYPIHCAKDTKKKGLQFNFSFGMSF
ncbi:MAG: outer membrane protein assembly factor BamA [Puniceicoccales bacterium]|nr:outer membrane protein assembly factor BamA [Puniceicoccales bacterium]